MFLFHGVKTLDKKPCRTQWPLKLDDGDIFFPQHGKSPLIFLLLTYTTRGVSLALLQPAGLERPPVNKQRIPASKI